MPSPILRLILDTNIWLDWLVFDDPSAAPLRAAVAECRRIARRSGSDPDSPGWGLTPIFLPRCTDPGDQIFLEAARAARADFLVTKDKALLDLARRSLPFRIVTPDGAA